MTVFCRIDTDKQLPTHLLWIVFLLTFADSTHAAANDSTSATVELAKSRNTIGVCAEAVSMAYRDALMYTIDEPPLYENGLQRFYHLSYTAQAATFGLSIKRLINTTNEAEAVGLDVQFQSFSTEQKSSCAVRVYNRTTSDSARVTTYFNGKYTSDYVRLRLYRSFAIGRQGLSICVAPVFSYHYRQLEDARQTLDTAYRWFLPNQQPYLNVDSLSNQVVFAESEQTVRNPYSAGLEVSIQYSTRLSGLLLEPFIGLALESDSFSIPIRMSSIRLGFRLTTDI